MFRAALACRCRRQRKASLALKGFVFPARPAIVEGLLRPRVICPERFPPSPGRERKRSRCPHLRDGDAICGERRTAEAGAAIHREPKKNCSRPAASPSPRQSHSEWKMIGGTDAVPGW